MERDVLAAAAEYLRHGFALLPLRGGSQAPEFDLLPQQNGSPTWKLLTLRPATLPEVRDWCERHPDLNLGILLGSCSCGLVVVDFHGPVPAGLLLPPTWAVATARGTQFYFRTGQRLCGFCFQMDGTEGEVRGEGSYAVAPPSVHPSGSHYRAVVPLAERDVAPLPDALLATLKAHAVRGKKEGPLPSETRPSFADATIDAPDERRYPARGSVASNDIFPCYGPLPPTAGAPDRERECPAYQKVACDPEAVRRVLCTVGVYVRSLNQSFPCPIEGHDTAKRASAELYQTDSGVILVVCFHEHQSYLPVDIYRLARSGKPITPTPAREGQADRGMRAIWWLRGLAQAGLVVPVPVPAEELPPDAPESVRKLYQGFLELLSLRAIHNPDQESAPFSWRFAGEWCGVASQETVGKAMRWLLTRGYLEAREGNCRSTLLAVGELARQRERPPSTARTVGATNQNDSVSADDLGDEGEVLVDSAD